MAKGKSGKEIPARSPRLERYSGNPLLEPNGTHFWESKAVFNPAAIHENGKVHLLYRAIGNADVSSIGYASSTDGFHIDSRLDLPAYVPREEFEGVRKSSTAPEDKVLQFTESFTDDNRYVSGGGAYGGCEDPRLTKIGNRIYMTYVAYNGYDPPRVALTSIHANDFNDQLWMWEKPVLISPPGIVDKNACILPEKIGSHYVIFHRIFPDILIDLVDDLDFDGRTRWLKGDARISPRTNRFWDSRKLGIGATPVKTPEGWLVVYHGVGERDPGRYKIGALLLDLKDPTREIGRLREPLLAPDADYENNGWKSGVVYPCGAVLLGNRLFVYYGASDRSTCVATVDLDTLLAGFD